MTRMSRGLCVASSSRPQAEAPYGPGRTASPVAVGRGFLMPTTQPHAAESPRQDRGLPCDLWLESYAHRESTERQAKVHLARIRKEFGPLPLMAVDEMAVKQWMAKLKREGLSQSYRFALHSRLSQVLGDAVYAKKLSANPCGKRTTPGAGKPRPYVATEAQLWQLYELADEKYRPAILLGALAGLRVAEVCGLRAGDVDLDSRVILPAVQYPAEPLKTEMSMTGIPIPDSFAGKLKRLLNGRTEGWVAEDDGGTQLGPWKVERHM